MIATGILHQTPWTWNVVVWVLGFAIVLIALGAAILITDLLRPRRPAVITRALYAFGPAAFAPLLFFLCMRVIQLIEPSVGAGPQHWLIGWIPGMAHSFVHPYDTLVAVHVASGVFVAATALLFALFLPPGPSRAAQVPLQGRQIAAAILLCCAALLPFVAFRVYVRDDDAAALLDLLGILPTTGLAVALRLYAWMPSPPQKAALGPAEDDAGPGVDPHAAWASQGLVGTDARPLLELEPKLDTSSPSPSSQAAWQAVAAPGQPPAALDALLDELPWSPRRTSSDGLARPGEMAPARLFCIGELPAEVETLLLRAVLADLLGARGMRVLLLHPDPKGLTQRIQADLVRARTWSPGAFAVGTDALQEQLAGHQMPALGAMTLQDFATRFVRMASSSARGWVQGLDLIVFHRPDLGTPVDVTHTTFACARWDLATRRFNRPPVLLTLPDAPALDAFAERLFPGREPRRLRYSPRTAGRTRVWPGREPDPEHARPWLARAAEAVTTHGCTVDVIDPAGSWSRDQLPDAALLSREATWGNRASTAELRAASLVDAVDTLANRLPSPELHDALWRIPDDPVSRFLDPARLQRLGASGRLPRAVPLIGTRNPFLRLAHLDIALREALNDEHSLRGVFGDDLVDHRLDNAENVVREATASAWREHGDVLRSPHLSSKAGPTGPLSSDTVTDDVVAVVDARSGDVIARVDALIAPTRYYPKRVFTVRERRYRVPMHAYDAKRRKLTVEVASSRDQVTRPVCTFTMDVLRTTVERVTRRHGRFEMHTQSADCQVTERVHAAWVPNLDQEERFDSVQATYSTEVRFVFPTKAERGPGLFHLAALCEALLPVFLRCDPSDVAVSPVPAGFLPKMGAGLAFIDRYPGGMGLARALDDGALAELLGWSRSMASECSCDKGCGSCSPSEVLRVGPDKVAVLATLDGL